MKIEFSKKELKALIELLYFGEYMFSFSGNYYPEKKINTPNYSIKYLMRQKKPINRTCGSI